MSLVGLVGNQFFPVREAFDFDILKYRPCTVNNSNQVGDGRGYVNGKFSWRMEMLWDMGRSQRQGRWRKLWHGLYLPRQGDVSRAQLHDGKPLLELCIIIGIRIEAC